MAFYDGNIGKAAKGKEKVIDYAKVNNIPIPPAKVERTWPDDITIEIRGETLSGKRSHDLYNPNTNAATEVKDYSTQNVNK